MSTRIKSIYDVTIIPSRQSWWRYRSFGLWSYCACFMSQKLLIQNRAFLFLLSSRKCSFDCSLLSVSLQEFQIFRRTMSIWNRLFRSLPILSRSLFIDSNFLLNKYRRVSRVFSRGIRLISILNDWTSKRATSWFRNSFNFSATQIFFNLETMRSLSLIQWSYLLSTFY